MKMGLDERGTYQPSNYQLMDDFKIILSFCEEMNVQRNDSGGSQEVCILVIIARLFPYQNRHPHQLFYILHVSSLNIIKMRKEKPFSMDRF